MSKVRFINFANCPPSIALIYVVHRRVSKRAIAISALMKIGVLFEERLVRGTERERKRKTEGRGCARTLAFAIIAFSPRGLHFPHKRLHKRVFGSKHRSPYSCQSYSFPRAYSGADHIALSELFKVPSPLQFSAFPPYRTNISSPNLREEFPFHMSIKIYRSS